MSSSTVALTPELKVLVPIESGNSTKYLFFTMNGLPLFFLTVFVLLSIASESSAAPRCTVSKHCNDLNDETVDFCHSHSRRCLNIPKTAFHDSDEHTIRQLSNVTFVRRTLKGLVEEVNSNPLSIADKERIITEVSRFVRGVNPHIFLHRNLLKVDIPAELQGLRAKLRSRSESGNTNAEFHFAMRGIFQQMDDLHSLYLPPTPLRDTIAVLGFASKEFFVHGDTLPSGTPRRRYAVSDVVDSTVLPDEEFVLGAELLKVDGEDMDKVVRRLGRDGFGSNEAAQITRGVTAVSIRNLQTDAVPFKPTAEIEFKTKAGRRRVVTLPWIFVQIVVPETAAEVMGPIPSGLLSKRGREEAGELLQSTLALGRLANLDPAFRIANGTRRTPIPINPRFESFIEPEILQTSVGPVGRLGILSFLAPGSVVASPEWVAEVSRVLKLMPSNGLIVDIRGNPGGAGAIVKAYIELLTSATVPKSPFVIRASKLMKQFVSEDFGNVVNTSRVDFDTFFGNFKTSVERALRVGEPFTGPGETILFSPNPTVQKRTYFGPIITVVDGATTSAGDLFAILQQDEGISQVVGVSDNVGAAGASTGPFSRFAEVFPKLLSPLPGGVDFRTAILRFFRTGKNNGAIVENFGMKPDVRYYPTLNDIVNEDCDLFEFLAKKVTENRQAPR